MPTQAWQEVKVETTAQPDAHLLHLAQSGALDEAERIIDAFDRGDNPLRPIPIDEFLKQVREK